MPLTQSAELSKSKSALFDFIRWTAALVVVVGHVNSYCNLIAGKGTTSAHPIYDYLSGHAHAAVMVFFVLSGYFVTFATVRKLETRDYRFRDYFLDRWSRIYSVLIAAVVFTIVLDFVGAALSPVYRDPAVIPQDHVALRLFLNLFSLQGVQGFRVQFGSNPALWSIGYEFMFYLLYGLTVFRKQLFRRQAVFAAVIVALLALFGVKVALYFLIWLLGVATFYLSRRFRIRLSWLSTAGALALLIVVNHFVTYLNVLRLNEFGSDLVFSIFVALFFLPEIDGGVPRWFARGNSWFAEYGYSIYAYHLPIVVFWYAVVERRSGFHLPVIAGAVIVPIVCLTVARLLFYISEAQRMRFRAVGRRGYDALASVGKPVTSLFLPSTEEVSPL
jgi:peptidoglycan/LPS O-acetylase OafA/YrhL